MTPRPLAASFAALALIPALATADAPRVSSFFPAGARRGETIQVEAEGSFKPWPVEAVADRPGVEIEADEESGRFTVVVAPDATPGTYWVRLSNDEGASSLRPFIVGTLPEVVEDEPNNANDQATPVDTPAVVVNGRLEERGDVDAFAVPLEAGQTLIAAVDANRRLGSPMDAILQVVSPEGFVVDHADDSPLLDPTLAFTAPTAGTYLVRVFAFPAEPDSSIRFSSGDDYVYRLTLTTGGLLAFAHPSAAPRDETPRLLAVGPGLADDAATLQFAPLDDDRAVAWRDDLAGTAEVSLVDLPVLVEPEVPDDDTPHDPIPLPAVISGRVAARDEVDTLTVSAPEGQSIAVRVAARSLGSPLDPVLRVLDASGDELAEEDDSRRSADPEVTLKVPAGGPLRLMVRDLHGRGGPDYIYRIEAREVAPAVSLSVDDDHIELSPGKPLEIEVSVDRRDDFDRPIAFEADGLPDGVTLQPAASQPKGDSAKEVKLRLVADDAPAWSGPIRLLGLPEGDGDASPLPVTTSLLDGSRTDALWLTVLPAD